MAQSIEQRLREAAKQRPELADLLNEAAGEIYSAREHVNEIAALIRSKDEQIDHLENDVAYWCRLYQKAIW